MTIRVSSLAKWLVGIEAPPVTGASEFVGEGVSEEGGTTTEERASEAAVSKAVNLAGI